MAHAVIDVTGSGWTFGPDADAPRRLCALGPAGIVPADAKREGDGATPAGLWTMRRVFFRPDREPPPVTALPIRALAEDDGWCDAPNDPAYNRPVRLPYPASAERLWRGDHVYDLIVAVSHNDDPPTPGMGSAVFLHLAHDDFRPTEGCVAFTRPDLLTILAAATPGDAIQITQS